MPAACGRPGRSAGRATSPSTRTSISLPSTSASTRGVEARRRRSGRRRTRSRRRGRALDVDVGVVRIGSLGGRRARLARSVPVGSVVVVGAGLAGRRRRSAGDRAAPARGRPRATVGRRRRRRRRPRRPRRRRSARRSAARSRRRSSLRRPRRRSCLGRTGAGRTRARTRASPRTRPNSPGSGSSRTSNSASSATTPSWSRASSFASSTVSRRRLDPLHRPLRSRRSPSCAASAASGVVSVGACRCSWLRLPPGRPDGRVGRWSPCPVGVGRFLGAVVRFDVAAARRRGVGAGVALGAAGRSPSRRPWPPARSRRLAWAKSRRHRRRRPALASSRAALAGALRLAAERLVVAVEAARDVGLLGDAQHRLRHVVDDQTGQEEHLEDGEHHRQVLHQLLLRRRHRRADRGAGGDHPLLEEVQAGRGATTSRA